MLAGSTPGAASSIVSLPVVSVNATPSIVMLGDPAAPAVEALPVASASNGSEIYAIGPSVLAYGADAIPAAREEVASIDDEPEQSQEPEWMSAELPLVIRGGERGDLVSEAIDAPAEEPAPDSAE